MRRTDIERFNPEFNTHLMSAGGTADDPQYGDPDYDEGGGGGDDDWDVTITQGPYDEDAVNAINAHFGEGGEEEIDWSEFEALDKRAADLMLEQHENYKDFYMPVADDISNWMDSAPEKQVKRSRYYGKEAGRTAEGIYQRNRERYGTGLGYRANQNMDNSRLMGRKANTIQQTNLTRQGMVDLENSVTQDFIGIGHGVQSSGVSGMTGAANLAMNQQIAALGAQNQASSYYNPIQPVNSPSKSGSFLGGLMGSI